ncbi:MAG: hypothetical protein NW214_04765 [Pseudanabaenaceae cyanobacterium bins.39]|nr:hypothetical protein [Pseudanabaenaceae cyanobacterium bins.39]
MTTLNPSTLRRLQKLKQSSAVWEGDRRALPAKIRQGQETSNIIPLHSLEEESKPHCLLWVDGSMGMVRSMDVVDAAVGHEAFVRTLLQAIEHPQSPAQPSLPQKILVSDRETQFYLRGVLQDLDIAVEYVERLPLIDEIFSHILESFTVTPPAVPEKYAAALRQQSEQLWHNAPWNILWDHQVLSIKIDRWDLETLYAIVMGKMGLERGVIFYRSQDSLIKFRQRIIAGESEDEIEETFLHQDCLFNLFESEEPEEDLSRLRHRLKKSHKPPTITPIYGTLHPLEGGRPYLYEEEAIALTVALEAVNQFWQQYQQVLSNGFREITGRYRIPVPSSEHGDKEEIEVRVATMPSLARELNQLAEDEASLYEDDEPKINEDLLPENSLIKLITIPWEQVEILKKSTAYCQIADQNLITLSKKKGEGLPSILIQTSRPKAQKLIADIQELGGIQSVCFNPAEDFLGVEYLLGLLVTGNDDLNLFAEFSQQAVNQSNYKRWQQRLKTSKGYVGIIIAMGLTGASRGKPSPQHILGYYEIKLIDPQELGVGTLLAQPILDLDF